MLALEAPLMRAMSRASAGLACVRRLITPAPVALLELVTQAWLSQALSVAASLGVADALAQGPKSLTQLARDTNAEPAALARLLRALSQHGIFTQSRWLGRYRNTRLSETLRSDHPQSVRRFAMFVGSARHREHWSGLEDSVRSGAPSAERLRGEPFFAYASRHRSFGRLFDGAMSELSGLMVGPLLACYDFSGCRRIVDVGGGRGDLLAAILEASPGAEGVLFDLPKVTHEAPARLLARGLTGRCRIQSGSFFEAIPQGADTYVLKQILHDWDDAQACTILQRLRQATETGARVLVIEMLRPRDGRAHLSKLTDLEMLVSVGGRERSEQEFHSLLAQNHFRLERVIHTGAPLSILEASAVPIPGPTS